MKKAFLSILLIGAVYQHIAAQTFTEVHAITCGDTVFIGNLGYPSWNVADITDLPALGHAVLLGDFIPANLLQYTSPPSVVSTDTVVIACAHATQITCDTGIYIFQAACPENLEHVFPTALACNDSVFVGNLSGWFAPEIIQPALNGEAHIVLLPTDGAGVFYRPNPGFEGLDAVVVTINNGDTLLYLFQVYCDFTVTTFDLTPDDLDFYPNPVSNELFVSGISNPAEVRIFNMKGQQCRAKIASDEDGVVIQTSHLPTGFYFIVLKTKQGVKLSGSFMKG